MVKLECAECGKSAKKLGKKRIPLIGYKGKVLCQNCLNKMRKEEHEKQEKEREKRQQEREKQNE